ncbi:MAG: ComEC/Rec2 family competence protein, partial [Patescibacteria group bacterium]
MFTVQALTSVVNQLLPEPHAGLLNGILFGTKAMLSKELYQALVTTGTLHIVALSGMNITILINLVHLLFLGFISRRLSSLLTMGVITGFVWFVGPSASVVRAAIMGGIGLLAVVFGRQTWAILSWLLAVSTMLLLNFSWLTDLSFQLSALATLGIILFGKGSAAEVGNEWGAYRGSFFTAHPSSAGNLRVTRGGGPPRRGPHM